MVDFDIHAATDITGFGLSGHGLEMAEGSGVRLEIELAKVPIMREALAMYEKGMTTGVNKLNRAQVEPKSRFEADVPDWHLEIVFDPQTSGGLMVALPEDQAESLVANLHDAGLGKAAVIGRAVEAGDDGASLVIL